ncbi:hypothetical protein GCM10010885_00990 [Alicyclobacillus cellulosilyticus]|uniref:Uncharacterized protein n=1 Tax=Alicyclobacillus cellulosilyticus TaxID=1003997 RepID=A0A917NG72_9BACL|nr:hypothetical protein [Alicyclobacillus cellulosilyticus]GGI95181.1 hypothetical protein GCM10010885_00990 [Alicyclobacillus cellulosilyticus]
MTDTGMTGSGKRLSRREYQRALARKRRLRQKRRRARLRRIKAARALRSVQFWTRAALFLAGLAAVAFWAKFALVYDIPLYARQGLLAGVRAYVTSKPWWFGPPVFDLAAYQPQDNLPAVVSNPYTLLLSRLGRYQAVVTAPHMVWVLRG